MNGFITLAIGEEYLQRAAALALSAARFGYPTILMVRETDPGKYAPLFHRIVSLAEVPTVNTAARMKAWELKQQAYACSAEFERCMFVDADSLLIKHPAELFSLAERYPIHTPGGRAIRDDEHWGVPSPWTTRQVARGLGVAEGSPLQTLNGGFLLWQRGEQAAHWFAEFGNAFGRVNDFYQTNSGRRFGIRDELCMSLAFASLGIDLPRSDSSIGVWDAHDLQLDIARQQFRCKKGYYWEGHQFEPYIAHFGGSQVSPRYRQCVQYLLADTDVQLPLFAKKVRPATATPGDVNPSHWDFSHWPELPKVSCQCITYGRPDLLNEAVESFLRQDYPGEKELVILNDHAEVLIENPGISQVTVINIARRFRTIGEKRNACCALCSGSIIVPWDDDDIHLPWRLSYSLQQMKNRNYYKPDRLWYWANGKLSVRKAVAHAMGAWSKSLFDQVGGYPHIQSGQDQAIETSFQETGMRVVENTPAEAISYIYRFPGTGSYHLSAHGFGKGFDEAERFIRQRVKPGSYSLQPNWRHDYVAAVQAELPQQELVK